MTKQLVLGTILGGIVLFFWSFIAWTFIPWPGEPLRSFNNEAALEQAIVSNAPVSGVYILPNPHKSGVTAEQQTASEEKLMRGPMVFASVRLGAMRPFPVLLITQLLIYLVSALIVTFLLLKTAGLSYGQRVVFVTICGLLIFLGGKMDQWVWWSFSTSYLMAEFGAIIIGWILAALVIAKFATGKPATV
ncbi:MAG TPA: hypothetical protein VJT71_10295 [Pyrinomonadaceae bacterium]|nr:hypothetical protein [Pyrinomonadaceae bacterium]